MTPEEKERMKESEKLRAFLAEFHRGELGSDELWQSLKGSRPPLLREAQLKLIDSISLADSPSEFQKRRDGVLAIETLKEEQNTSMAEQALASIGAVQERSKEGIAQAYDRFMAEVERNPQLRTKQIHQGQGTMIVQLTTEEAVQQLPEWRHFVSEHEKEYRQEFAKLIEKLELELK
jgi:hypothetical protein